MHPTPTQIKETAEQSDCGFRCYCNIKTGELVSIPDFDDSMSDLGDFFAEDLAKVKKGKKNFIKITKPTSTESFEIMEAFVQQLSYEPLANKLLGALSKKQPFANFKAMIDSAGSYRQNWFDFKLMKLQTYVLERIPKNI